VTARHSAISEELALVADCHEVATFGRHVPDGDDLERIERAADNVSQSVTATMSWRQRVRTKVDPAPVLAVIGIGRT
jgi:hypothetical protein